MFCVMRVRSKNMRLAFFRRTRWRASRIFEATTCVLALLVRCCLAVQYLEQFHSSSSSNVQIAIEWLGLDLEAYLKHNKRLSKKKTCAVRVDFEVAIALPAHLCKCCLFRASVCLSALTSFALVGLSAIPMPKWTSYRNAWWNRVYLCFCKLPKFNGVTRQCDRDDAVDDDGDDWLMIWLHRTTFFLVHSYKFNCKVWRMIMKKSAKNIYMNMHMKCLCIYKFIQTRDRERERERTRDAQRVSDKLRKCAAAVQFFFSSLLVYTQVVNWKGVHLLRHHRRRTAAELNDFTLVANLCADSIPKNRSTPFAWSHQSQPTARV